MPKIYYKDKKSEKLSEISSLRKGSWLHLDNANEEKLVDLCNTLKLDEAIVKDILDKHEVPRIEREDGIHYIFTRISDTPSGLSATTPLLIIITQDIFITISHDKSNLIETFLQKEYFLTTQKTKLSIQLFLFINQDYQNAIRKISKEIRNATKDIENIKNKDVTKLVRYEAIFNDYLSALEPGNITLEKLLSGKYLTLYEEDRDLVEDLFIDNSQLIDECQMFLKHIVNVRDAYTTIISNNLNKTMKLLTSVTAILTVPTMIASFYGMNVGLPLENSPYGFIVVVGLSAFISMFLLILFLKKDMF